MGRYRGPAGLRSLSRRGLNKGRGHVPHLVDLSIIGLKSGRKELARLIGHPLFCTQPSHRQPLGHPTPLGIYPRAQRHPSSFPSHLARALRTDTSLDCSRLCFDFSPTVPVPGRCVSRLARTVMHLYLYCAPGIGSLVLLAHDAIAMDTFGFVIQWRAESMRVSRDLVGGHVWSCELAAGRATLLADKSFN